MIEKTLERIAASLEILAGQVKPTVFAGPAGVKITQLEGGVNLVTPDPEEKLNRKAVIAELEGLGVKFGKSQNTKCLANTLAKAKGAAASMDKTPEDDAPTNGGETIPPAADVTKTPEFAAALSELEKFYAKNGKEAAMALLTERNVEKLSDLSTSQLSALTVCMTAPTKAAPAAAGMFE